LNRLDREGEKCEVNVHYSNVLFGAFKHYGLTVKTDVKGVPNDFYLDAGPTDGPILGTLGVSKLEFHYVSPRDGRYNEMDLGFGGINDDFCRCLWNYSIKFNNAKLSYDKFCMNSNWSIRCILNHCGVGINWGDKPVGWDCKVCTEYKVLQFRSHNCGSPVDCIKWGDAPCP